ncbi:ParB/RepB/Spo0J family partition protein [bacterium]|nr:ParB/RepB/Spo0J family partition protein [bacterium]
MAKQVKRGLNALLANIEDDRESTVVCGEDKVLSIPIEKIKPNPNQPRKEFKQESILELSQSIRNHGIIQPLVVKKDCSDYIIIAGERRYRAAILAELKEVPAIIMDISEQKSKEIALIENLQREDLNAIDEAEAIRELMVNYSLKQEEIAQKLGKARPSIANTVRLLNLAPEIKELVRSEKLSAGHARAILALPKQADQIKIVREILANDWSVRETEKQVRYLLKPETKPTKLTEKVKAKMTVEMRDFVSDMTRVFATKVKLMGNETKGRITIDYFTNDDLQRIYDLIEILKEKNRL